MYVNRNEYMMKTGWQMQADQQPLNDSSSLHLYLSVTWQNNNVVLYVRHVDCLNPEMQCVRPGNGARVNLGGWEQRTLQEDGSLDTAQQAGDSRG